MKRPTPSRLRHAWRRPAWRLWALALVLCTLAATPAGASQVQLFEWPEAMTLEEAAGFLRIEPGELESLALRDRVPARRIGAQWRFSRSALTAWLAGDWKLIAGLVPPSSDYLASGVDPEATPAAGAAPLISHLPAFADLCHTWPAAKTARIPLITQIGTTRVGGFLLL